MAENEFEEGNNLPDTDTEVQTIVTEDKAEEAELLPPNEKNEAKQLNLGNIFLVIIIAVTIVFGIIMIFSKPRNAKQKETVIAEVKSKFIPEPKIQEETPVASDTENLGKETNIDEIIQNLPPSFQPQPDPSPAPVASINSSKKSSSATSERPDTRNSKSQRKIDGIAGQNYALQQANNQNIVSSVMNGNGYGQQPYTSGGGYGNGMTKEEYVNQMMASSGAASGGYGGYANATQTQQYQSNKEAFFNNGTGGSAGSGQYLSYASLWEGTIISGALETAINTDNPGVVIARVTENVYSSYDASFLLIPEGSLLYATYNSSVSYGQNRVQVAWNLLIRPDGYRIVLGNMNGVDAQGASGTKGHVTNHPFQTLKALGLVAVYSVIQTEINQQIKDNDNRYIQNAMADTYTEASKIGNKILDKALDIKPTIKIKSGTEIKLITNLTLNLPPVKPYPVTRKYVRTP